MQLIIFVIVLVATAASVPSLLPTNTKLSDGRIIGGTEVDISEAPYQAAVGLNGSFLCNGAIISQLFVINAAHCTYGVTVTTITIGVGSSLLRSGEQLIAVAAEVSHPSFNPLTLDYDVSLLQLASNLQFSEYVQPVNLPVAGTTWDAGLNVVVSGWDTTSQSKSTLSQLQAVTMQIISQDLCQLIYPLSSITSRMLCADATDGGIVGACSSDSGSPLVEPTQGVLVGVVSWGAGCAQGILPTVFTNLADPSIRSFISNVTQI